MLEAKPEAMPPRARRARSEERGDGQAADIGDREYGPSDRHFLMKLTSDNFDEWDRQVRHMFYALDWLPMYEASRNGGRADDTLASHRRKAWGRVTSSLGGDMTSKIDDVELGEVEALLRLIREKYYKSTVQSKSKLRR